MIQPSLCFVYSHTVGSSIYYRKWRLILNSFGKTWWPFRSNRICMVWRRESVCTYKHLRNKTCNIFCTMVFFLSRNFTFFLTTRLRYYRKGKETCNSFWPFAVHCQQPKFIHRKMFTRSIKPTRKLFTEVQLKCRQWSKILRLLENYKTDGTHTSDK